MKSFIVLFLLFTSTLAVAQSESAEPGIVVPLVIEGFQCVGNETTDCEFIKSQIFLEPGGQLKDEEVENAKIRLSFLPQFEQSDIRLQKGSERGKVILEITVKERTAIFSELTSGTSLRDGDIAQRLAGRVGYQNLFGKGKTLEIHVDSKIPMGKNKDQAFYSRAQYTDPNLFGSKKYFFSSGFSFIDRSSEASDYSSYRRQLGADLAVGRRFADFSYVSLGYLHFPTSSEVHGRFYTDYGWQTTRYQSKNGLLLNYGWNSEDDPYFPTQGSRFLTALAWEFADQNSSTRISTLAVQLAYRTTWRGRNDGVWSFNLGGTPTQINQPSFADDFGVSWSYSKPLKFETNDVQRARWFVEAGSPKGLGYSTSSGVIADVGAKAGIRIGSKSLGIVELYGMASTDFRGH